MRNPNPSITLDIKTKTLALLMMKEPAEIGMRDIARNCGITAANIYHYYKDKDTLFQEIALDCLNELNITISLAAEKAADPKEAIYKAIYAFSDWCFEHPRKSMLVMSGIKSADQAPVEVIEQYYVCNRTGIVLLKKCMDLGLAKSDNPSLDVGILVNGVWGCIEAVINKKCDYIYWDNGKPYVERFVQLWVNQIFIN